MDNDDFPRGGTTVKKAKTLTEKDLFQVNLKIIFNSCIIYIYIYSNSLILKFARII